MAAATLAVLGIGAWTVSSVSADRPPEETEVITVNCGEGDFTVTAHGDGKFGTARIDATGEIFVVTAFANQHGTFTDNQGNVEEFDEPDVSHRAPPNRDLIDCHFTAVFESEFGTETFEGDVTGFIAGPPNG
jgi:hypothetical protein